MSDLIILRQMLRDIDGEVGDIYDAAKFILNSTKSIDNTGKSSKITDDLKMRYNAIEQDIRSVAGMYAKVKITHFGGDRRKKAETNIIDNKIEDLADI